MENQNDTQSQAAQTTAENAAAAAMHAPVDAEASAAAGEQAGVQDAAEAPIEPLDADTEDEAADEPAGGYRRDNAGELGDPDDPRNYEGASAKVLNEGESVQRAKFPQLEGTITTQALGKIEYLKDVDLEASVELGNTVLTVEKILNLNVGSIIELNQTIGDQVRLLINGNPYACGEVVVIGDKFGVRITKLLH